MQVNHVLIGEQELGMLVGKLRLVLKDYPGPLDSNGMPNGPEAKYLIEVVEHLKSRAQECQELAKREARRDKNLQENLSSLGSAYIKCQVCGHEVSRGSQVTHKDGSKFCGMQHHDEYDLGKYGVDRLGQHAVNHMGFMSRNAPGYRVILALADKTIDYQQCSLVSMGPGVAIIFNHHRIDGSIVKIESQGVPFIIEPQ